MTLVDVEEQEQRVKTLRLQITARTRSIANDEQAIQVTYPLVFSKLEHAADHELVRVKKSLCALKNICRARSQTHWKQWRVQREEELATTFMENYKVLQEDKQFALRNRQVRYNFVAASKAFSLLEKATLAKSRYGSKGTYSQPILILSLDVLARDFTMRRMVSAIQDDRGAIGD